MLFKSLGKNGVVFGIALLTALIYFKIISNYMSVDELATYFSFKAVALLFYYLLCIRFSEVVFTVKSALDLSYDNVRMFVSAYGFVVVFFSVLSFLTVGFLENEFVVGSLLAFFVYYVDDVIECYVATSRLFHQYTFIFLLRVFIIIKPALLYIALQSEVELSPLNIIEYELIFSTVIVLFLCLKKRFVFLQIKNAIDYVFDNRRVVFSSWAQSWSKASYEALPQALMAQSVTSMAFVEYNIARKMLSFFGSSMAPVTQVFQALSVNYKHNFVAFYRKYLMFVGVLSLTISFLVIYFSNEIVSILSKSDYATGSTFLLVKVFFAFYCVYLFIYPIRQLIVFRDYFKIFNYVLVCSLILFVFGSFVLVDNFGVVGGSIIQGVGLTFPVMMTIIVVFFKKRRRSK